MKHKQKYHATKTFWDWALGKGNSPFTLEGWHKVKMPRNPEGKILGIKMNEEDAVDLATKEAEENPEYFTDHDCKGEKCDYPSHEQI